MTKKIDPQKSLLYDADVIFHYKTGDRLLDLFNTFPNKSLILEQVYLEVTVARETKTTIDNLINLGLIEKIDFPTNPEIIKEYAHLTSALMNRGKGESACMAYCKFSNDVIASSNLRDIGEYCKLHSIDYLTTMDFVERSYLDGKWDEETCDTFIKKVKNKHIFPFVSFSDFKNHLDINSSA